MISYANSDAHILASRSASPRQIMANDNTIIRSAISAHPTPLKLSPKSVRVPIPFSDTGSFSTNIVPIKQLKDWSNDPVSQRDVLDTPELAYQCEGPAQDIHHSSVVCEIREGSHDWGSENLSYTANSSDPPKTRSSPHLNFQTNVTFINELDNQFQQDMYSPQHADSFPTYPESDHHQSDMPQGIEELSSPYSPRTNIDDSSFSIPNSIISRLYANPGPVFQMSPMSSPLTPSPHTVADAMATESFDPASLIDIEELNFSWAPFLRSGQITEHAPDLESIPESASEPPGSKRPNKDVPSILLPNSPSMIYQPQPRHLHPRFDNFFEDGLSHTPVRHHNSDHSQPDAPTRTPSSGFTFEHIESNGELWRQYGENGMAVTFEGKQEGVSKETTPEQGDTAMKPTDQSFTSVPGVYVSPLRESSEGKSLKQTVSTPIQNISGH
jgi:hypothetical protein